MGTTNYRLPGDYNADRVIGITEGRERPTVYFDDYARFTQCHTNQDNIGFHSAPENHHFFGNITRAKMYELYSNGKAGLRNLLRDYEPGTTQIPTAHVADTNARLFELKDRNGRLTPHISGGRLVQQSKFQYAMILARLRERSVTKEVIGRDDRQRPIYGFV